MDKDVKRNFSLLKHCSCGKWINNRSKQCKSCSKKTGLILKCEICGKDTFKEKYYLKLVKHVTCSQKCASALKTRFYSGKNASNWKGGRYLSEYRLVRKQPKFRKWVVEQKIAMGGRCENCGYSHGVELHHIIPVSVDPTLIDNLKNLVLLCEKCHDSLHSKNKVRNQAYFDMSFEDRIFDLNVSLSA
jgi:5-methylcytosine-specific restriction endonuclease McrA